MCAGADDAARYCSLEAALCSIGLEGTLGLQPLVRAILACLLLGDICILESSLDGSDGAKVTLGGWVGSTGQSSLDFVSKALNVEVSALEKALSVKQINVRRENSCEMLECPYMKQQALDARDALAKAVYEAIFGWLVCRINEGLGSPRGKTSCDHDSMVSHGSVGILDIFGFESFERNSFEQLCINYANEKLQGHFNSVVFMLEQREYETEGVCWKHIEHASNEATLALLEGRMGVRMHPLDTPLMIPSRTFAR